MKPEGPLSRLKVPATCPDPEPVQSSPCPHPTSRKSILILSSYLSLDLPSGVFPSRFPTKTLYALILSPIRATCPAYLILLDFITRIIFVAVYRSLSFSLRDCLHYPVNSSLLTQNILLSTQFQTRSTVFGLN